ncbi:hypothetical protein NIES806_21090 [Dolichospermum compactum NIES-806]|uniref:Uncharacterized protein n=1 Tax=Dolichospermum compactum NIES-806 TaxID=1973481 RepID=A0A1Z4V3N1_9CYAN|nr:hypothetical protein NIES806_21090 [Dolichospermum compactum NIES-806]
MKPNKAEKGECFGILGGIFVTITYDNTLFIGFVKTLWVLV